MPSAESEPSMKGVSLKMLLFFFVSLLLGTIFLQSDQKLTSSVGSMLISTNISPLKSDASDSDSFLRNSNTEGAVHKSEENNDDGEDLYSEHPEDETEVDEKSWDEEDDDEIEDMESSLDAVAFLRPRQLCPPTATVVRFYFPHVNKAGGRTLEGTFNFPTKDPQFRFLPQLPRSEKYQFLLEDGHTDYNKLLRRKMRSESSNKVCNRWIFMIRNPLARTLSAFYTKVGRNRFRDPSIPTTPLTDHFFCTSLHIQALMENPDFTFEDFARLPKKERDTCLESVSDLHVRYLSLNRDLGVAKRRVLKMAFVGIAEDFAQSMQLLNWELNLDLNLYTPIFNKNTYDTNVSAAALAVLEEFNSLDLPFYKFAKEEVFDQRLRAMRAADDQKPLFRCNNENAICWDKRGQSRSPGNFDVNWPISENPLNRFKSMGAMKANSLCGNGCFSSVQKSCLASFFVIGARKGGTTSMYLYLSQHPQVRGILLNRGAKTGETFFFEFVKPNLEIGEIRRLYNRVFLKELQGEISGETITGESSVGMGPSCQTPSLLTSTCGVNNVKLIYLLREPLSRMKSQHQMRLRIGTVQPNDLEDFNADAKRHLLAFKQHADYSKLMQWLKRDDLTSVLPPCMYPNDRANPNPLWAGLYIVHLARWIHFVPLKQVLIVQSEHFFKTPEVSYRQALEFLGLNSSLVNASSITKEVYNADSPIVAIGSNRTQQYQVDKELMKELQDFFRPFNERLYKWFRDESITGFDPWKDRWT